MSTATTLGFAHVHSPPHAESTDKHTVLLLHGTGGAEHDLLDLGAKVAPDMRLLGVRGQVLESGMPRFFRRLAEGVFDEDDIVRRAADLAAFIRTAAETYGFDATKVVALGYSNGANIAAALMLLHPGTLSGAALLRAMLPLVPPVLPSLAGTPVLMAEGVLDPIIPRANTERLAALLAECGAEVTVNWEPTGHGITPADVAVTQRWMSGLR